VVPPTHLDVVRAAPVDRRGRIVQGPVGHDESPGWRDIVHNLAKGGAVHREVVVPIDGSK